MNKSLFLFIFFISTSFSVSAQLTFFLKNNGKFVDGIDSADIVRLILPPDSGSKLFTAKEFYASGTKKSIGTVTSVYPLRYHGEYKSFYETG
jgi:hypothetical protein